MTTNANARRWKKLAAALAGAVLVGIAILPLMGTAQNAAVQPAAVPASSPTATSGASSAGPGPALAPPPADAVVARGEYLARAGDCISCHSRPGGAPFAGGLAMNTPFGAIVSTNITPDSEQGIGQYTLADFTHALREGKDRDGDFLYPAMPYTNFAKMTDDDLSALYAYFIKGVQPAKQHNAKTSLTWPFSMRWLMAGWNALYLHKETYTAEPAQTAEWNRGAYLVQGLGHCGACHTPRSITGAEKAPTHKDGERFLAGTIIDGWYAQPLRNTTETNGAGLLGWSGEDIVDYLKTGRNKHTAAFGAMTEVVANSTQYLSRQDLAAIATYLKSLGDSPGTVAANAPPVSSEAATLVLQQGSVSQRGAMVYLNNCNACHRSDGQGAQRTFPTLAHNSAVEAADPTSLIRIVLEGSAMAHTEEAPSRLAMPGFGWRLTDDNVADVVSFIRSSWGNQAASISPGNVGKVRDALVKSAKAGVNR